MHRLEIHQSIGPDGDEQSECQGGLGTGGNRLQDNGAPLIMDSSHIETSNCFSFKRHKVVQQQFDPVSPSELLNSVSGAVM